MRLVGFEAGGEGVETGRHAARFSGGAPGVLHGARSYLLQDDDGQTLPIPLDLGRAGLPGRRPGSTPGCTTPGGPSTARSPTPRRWTRSACCAAPRGSSRRSSPPTRWPGRCALGPELASWDLDHDPLILINLSGRGDKDVETAAQWFGLLEEDES